jgi:hypothetical protein
MKVSDYLDELVYYSFGGLFLIVGIFWGFSNQFKYWYLNVIAAVIGVWVIWWTNKRYPGKKKL